MFTALLLLYPLADETKKKDQELMEGTWTVEKFIAEGKDAPAETTGKMRIVFEGTHFTLRSQEKGEEKHGFELDATKKPRQMDILERKGKDGKIPAVYEIDGDTLKICWNKSDPETKGRPTSFDANEKNRWSLLILKRKK